MVKEKSEFGKGCAYCLGLFLAHSERDFLARDFAKTEDEKKAIRIVNSMWFNGAGDHLFELEIPEKFPMKLQKRLRKFREFVLKRRLVLEEKEKVTEKDKQWAIKEAKLLLLEIDKYLEIDCEEAEWD